MTPLSFTENLREVLFLGAHCDDVEIGCGGTLAALARECPQAHLRIVVFSGDEVRAPETRAAIAALLPAAARYDLEIASFRDGFFPDHWPQIKEYFEGLRRRCNPDVIFTHYEHDRHQDHRTVCELTWNTFRDHTVLEYEIPKYDGDLGRPSVYVALPAELVEHKTRALLTCFASQAGKRWFTADLFAALMRLRGMECNASSGFAEAFYARKVLAAWPSERRARS
jgi:LmbE family N-acetylglucosaminyl deacetylase